jgi:hypothetical protein
MRLELVTAIEAMRHNHESLRGEGSNARFECRLRIFENLKESFAARVVPMQVKNHAVRGGGREGTRRENCNFPRKMRGFSDAASDFAKNGGAGLAEPGACVKKGRSQEKEKCGEGKCPSHESSVSGQTLLVNFLDFEQRLVFDVVYESTYPFRSICFFHWRA